MTKALKRIVNHPNQGSLFDLLVQEYNRPIAGTNCSMSVTTTLQATIRNAIRNAGKNRGVIAEEMTDLSGCHVSVHQLNNWTAESHPHHIPAEILPAFCQATGSIEPIRILAEAEGVYILSGPDVLRAEIQKIDEESKRLNREKRKRELFLKELDK